MIQGNTVKTFLDSGERHWVEKAPNTTFTVANTIPEKRLLVVIHGDSKITQVVNQKLKLLKDEARDQTVTIAAYNSNIMPKQDVNNL